MKKRIKKHNTASTASSRINDLGTASIRKVLTYTLHEKLNKQFTDKLDVMYDQLVSNLEGNV